ADPVTRCYAYHLLIRCERCGGARVVRAQVDCPTTRAPDGRRSFDTAMRNGIMLSGVAGLTMVFVVGCGGRLAEDSNTLDGDGGVDVTDDGGAASSSSSSGSGATG